MAHKNLGVMLRRRSSSGDGCLCDISHRSGRNQRGQGDPKPRSAARLQHIRHLVPGGSLLFDHRPRVLPLDPNIPLPREGLRLGLAPEASSRLDVALCVHRFYAGVVLRGTYICPKSST